MKKLLFFLCLIMPIMTDSCNLCRGFKYNSKLLYRGTREIVECDCNCWQQPRVKHTDGYGYGCTACGHRLIPEDPFEKLPKKKSKNPTWNPTSKRFNRWS